jgi:hypothetical protein
MRGYERGGAGPVRLGEWRYLQLACEQARFLNQRCGNPFTVAGQGRRLREVELITAKVVNGGGFGTKPT